MVQLKFQPTRAPSFAGVSDILKNAGLAMDRGFEAAQGMLGSYQEGQQESVDNEVFAELQALEGREAIDAYFDKGGLKGRRVSPKMMEHMAQMRGTAAVTALNRQSTANMLGGETRRQQEHDFTTGKRAQAISNAPQYARAIEEQYQGGTVPTTAATQLDAAAPTTPGGVPVVGDGSRAPAHLVTNESGGSFGATNESVGAGGIKGHDGRVQAGAARLTDAKNAGVIPEGMTREQFRNDPKAQIAFENWHFDDIDANIEKSGYSKYIGTTINGVKVTHQGMADVQHLGGATGLKKFLESNGEYNVEDDNGTSLTDYMRAGGAAEDQAAPSPAGQADPLDALRRAAGGPGSAINTQTATPGRTPAEVLAGAGKAGIPAYTEAAAVEAEGIAQDEAEAAGVAAPATQTIEQAVNPNSERDAYMKMLAEDNQYLTGPELVARANAMRDARTAGKADRAATRARQVDDLVSAEIFASVMDPNNIKQSDIAKAVANIPGLTAQERNAALAKAGKLVGEDGVLNPFLTPSITDAIDPAVSRVLADEMAAGEESIKVLPQHRLYEYMETFGDDPVQGLWDRLDLSNDKHTPETWGWGIGGEDGTDQNIIRKLTNEIALAADVTPAVAAAGMAENFIRDPSGWNSAASRFQKDKTIAFLKLNMNKDARAAYEGKKEAVALRRDDLTKAAKNLKNLVTKREKMADGSPAATLADREIRSLRTVLKSGNSPQEADAALAKYIGGNGMADQLKKVEMGSPAYKAGVKLLLSQIENDDELTSSQKLLLRTRISG